MALAPEHSILTVPAVGQPARDALRQQCYDVRIDVFSHEQGFPLDTEIDDLDAAATHFLLRLEPSHKPIGTIRCTKHAEYYKLSRLAVLKDYRKFRFGRELVLALHEFVRQDATASGTHGAVKIVAHSQIPVMPFYAKFGYEPEGGEFDEDGAPHQKMVNHLSVSD
ncbi:acyl-CoA N-acyltransferase [Obba rivulosa]|uniref:Acyl-CoA N-acyltransferase n=1 Tax=Obba rivulosa TaxID=1052685 RepID=A0A8E2DUP7_9APHY|nr:acyl-CoA N-acyltransferase [Obba rivulosa]